MPSLDPAIEAVQKAEHLSKETRCVYSSKGSKLRIIAKAAGNQPLLEVLSHYPNKVIQYITRSYTEIASQKTMLVSIMAVYRLLNITVKAQSSYDLYLASFDKLAVLRQEHNQSSKQTPSSRLHHSRRAPAGQEEASS